MASTNSVCSAIQRKLTAVKRIFALHFLPLSNRLVSKQGDFIAIEPGLLVKTNRLSEVRGKFMKRQAVLRSLQVLLAVALGLTPSAAFAQNTVPPVVEPAAPAVSPPVLPVEPENTPPPTQMPQVKPPQDVPPVAVEPAPKPVKRKGPVDALKPGQFVWVAQDTYEGPMKIVVVLDIQRVYVFQNDKLIGFSTISSGKKGKETPTGVFNILQKNIDHKSNLYSNAPMPFMQRLTWDGIALHGGHLPGYPASHGCIRLPHAFAKSLYGVTKMNQEVVVLKDTATPVKRPEPKPVVVPPPVVAPVVDPAVTPPASPPKPPETSGIY